MIDEAVRPALFLPPSVGSNPFPQLPLYRSRYPDWPFDERERAGKDALLRSRARVQGDVFAAGGLTKQTDVEVTGLTRSNTPITPLRASTWEVEFPPQTLGSASLEPDASRTIAPGGYTNAYIKSRSTLSVSAGTYVFDNLGLEPQARLSVNDSAGPVIRLRPARSSTTAHSRGSYSSPRRR